MRFATIALVLLPASLPGQSLPAQYRGLVDSLSLAVSARPESLLYQRPDQEQAVAGMSVLGDFNPETKAMRLSPSASRPRWRLAHEFGHLLQFTNQSIFFDWLDLTGHATADRADLERFADDFADTFEALASGDLKAATHGRRAVIAAYLRAREPFLADVSIR